MKTSITSTLAAIGLCAALWTTAQAQEPTAPMTAVDQNGTIIVMPPYSARSDIPVPADRIPLNVGSEYAGRQVDMVFMVDKNGRAYNVDADTFNMPDRYTNVKTASLVTQLALSIQGWTFEPAHDANGNPIERRVRLPITLG